MKNRISLLLVVGVFAVAVSVTSALAASKTTAPGAGTTLRIANSPFGRILVDGNGRTLYDFPPDTRGASTCYGACAALWPPLTTIGKPHAGGGVAPSLVGTTRRTDGKVEVTYGGHPLYYYVADSKRGETTGQGLNQFGAPWWVISPAGKEIHRG
jgi:predicted lipoprotein with Yx(FWY)xxD motif